MNNRHSAESCSIAPPTLKNHWTNEFILYIRYGSLPLFLYFNIFDFGLNPSIYTFLYQTIFNFQMEVLLFDPQKETF